MNTRLVTTVTHMADANIIHSRPEVFITESVYTIRHYLKAMYDYEMTASDVSMLWDLLDPESAVTGLSWAMGDTSGAHLAFEIQSGEFAVVNMGDAK